MGTSKLLGQPDKMVVVTRHSGSGRPYALHDATRMDNDDDNDEPGVRLASYPVGEAILLHTETGIKSGQVQALYLLPSTVSRPKEPLLLGSCYYRVAVTFGWLNI